jgi:hypothetical protein
VKWSLLQRAQEIADLRSGVNFINILCLIFLYKIFGTKISNPKASFVVFGAKILYEKYARKTLMKLTAELSLFVRQTMQPTN